MLDNRQNNSIVKKESLSRTSIPIIALIAYVICLLIVWRFVTNNRAQIVISLAALFISFAVWLTNYLELIRNLKGYFLSNNPSLKERTSNIPITAKKSILEINAEILIYNPSSTTNIIYLARYFLRMRTTKDIDYQLTSHSIKIPLVFEGYKASKHNIELIGEQDIPDGFRFGQTKCELFGSFKTIFGKDLLIKSKTFVAGR